MKFLFASDSFKGSLRSDQAHALLTAAAQEVFPGCETASLPMADGGEGTVAAVVAALGGRLRRVAVLDPLLRPNQADYGLLPAGGAIIEMAAASGLCLVEPALRNPLRTSSYGLGQLIRDGLEQGLRQISIAIGGSATNDGGLGALTALGARFLDDQGQPLSGCGRDLGRVAEIDLSGLHPAIGKTTFTLLCDVDNPLLGPEGATYTFGPQKGGDSAALAALEAGMVHYSQALAQVFPAAQVDFPGAGAAGGLGCALRLFLNARICSGIQAVLELVEFDRQLAGVDCVITGEGRLDSQTCRGKVVSGVALHCQARHIPVIALVGSIQPGAEALPGLSAALPIVDGPCCLQEALSQAPTLYAAAARRLFRLLSAGQRLPAIR